MSRLHELMAEAHAASGTDLSAVAAAPTDVAPTALSRRAMLAGAGLVIAFSFTPRTARGADEKKAAGPEKKKAPPPPPNAFLRIAPDESVTVILAHSEMGQGIWTGLAMVIAEELGCDWTKMKSEHAPASIVYGHPAFGIQMTGGSSTTNGEFERYRTVGAMAKDMLVRAAATRLKVAPAQCKVENGFIMATGGKDRVTFGAVAEEAMKLTPPASVKLKDPSEWQYIGKPMKRMDSPEKITGKAMFGMDVQFPGLRSAVVARPPQFGAKLVKFDATEAMKVKGVEKVVRTTNGVAVVAAHYWAAKVGRDALKVEWSAPEKVVDTTQMIAEYKELAKEKGPVAIDKGNVDDALGKAKSKLELVYDVPYLAHSPMEPLNCAVKIEADGSCEIWTGSQMQTIDHGAAVKILGVSPDKVKLHTMFLGGGFGRRANPHADFVSEAVETAKAAGVPVKVVWTREDDIKGGFYRPAFVHRIEVGVDDKGMPVAWKHGIVGQSIMAGTIMESMIKNGIDNASVEGVTDSPYIDNVPARRVTLHSPTSPVTVLWWRSVGNTHTAFAMESAIDELAAAAKKDPLEYRLALLKGKERQLAALKVVADKIGWGKKRDNTGIGLAVHESFGSIVAEAAEVSVEKGKLRVHRVVACVDCGQVVNPLGVEAQIQGSVAYGLSAAMLGAITLKNGAVEQSNFNDYRVLRMNEMPKVEVVIQKSKAKMGGIGEPATAPLAPAVANAIFAASGQRLRSLPFKLEAKS